MQHLFKGGSSVLLMCRRNGGCTQPGCTTDRGPPTQARSGDNEMIKKTNSLLAKEGASSTMAPAARTTSTTAGRAAWGTVAAAQSKGGAVGDRERGVHNSVVTTPRPSAGLAAGRPTGRSRKRLLTKDAKKNKDRLLALASP